MKSDRDRLLTAILMLAVFQLQTVHATDVFTWQDGDGVTHYSQWPPERLALGDSGIQVARLIVNDANPPGYDPADDPYSIRNQAERTNAVWKSVEERRESRRKRKQEDRQQSRETQLSQSTDDSYLYYARPWYRPPHWAGHRPGFAPRPPVQRPQPASKPDFSPDPMRSAHIGVRRRAPSASSPGVE